MIIFVKGFFITLPYCFLNSEVCNTIRLHWDRWRMTRQEFNSHILPYYILSHNAKLILSISGAAIFKDMDEGTLKTPIPKCRLYWSFLFEVVKQFFVGSE